MKKLPNLFMIYLAYLNIWNSASDNMYDGV